jgi:hypothetical protein
MRRHTDPGQDRPTCRPGEQGDDRPIVAFSGHHEGPAGRQEFDVRFPVDPNADMLALAGALHEIVRPPVATEALEFTCDLLSALCAIRVLYTDGKPDLVLKVWPRRSMN